MEGGNEDAKSEAKSDVKSTSSKYSHLSKEEKQAIKKEREERRKDREERKKQRDEQRAQNEAKREEREKKKLNKFNPDDIIEEKVGEEDDEDGTSKNLQTEDLQIQNRESKASKDLT